MAKEKIPFEAFVASVGAEHEEFVNSLHEFMIGNNCTCEIKEAASGYVVSYVYKPEKRTVANYVFRKKGPLLRVYADNVIKYMHILESWPASMKATVNKAGPCKRMLNPDDCNSRCVMGFDFIMDGVRQQKCRYGGFMFFLSDETKPHLREMMEQEMLARTTKRMINIVIAKGTTSDIPELNRLYDNLNDYLSSTINYPGWKKGVYPALVDAENGVNDDCLYVAKLDGVIVGSVILNHEPENAYDGADWKSQSDDYSRIYVIRTFVVNHEYHRLRIGQLLLQFAYDLARVEGMSSIRLDVYESNEPAIALYEKMGYEHVGTVDLGLSEYGLDYFKLYELVM